MTNVKGKFKPWLETLNFFYFVTTLTVLEGLTCQSLELWKKHGFIY